MIHMNLENFVAETFDIGYYVLMFSYIYSIENFVIRFQSVHVKHIKKGVTDVFTD